jgi:Fur family iron response transcriptional regulator
MQQKIDKILKAKNIASTPQRIAVCNVFFAAHTHLSADQVLSQVNSSGNPVSKATVYNTLRLFVDSGLLREITVNPERLFYDSRTDPHHHMYNADTGELTDIEPDDVTFASMPELPHGTETERVDVVIQIRTRS